MNDLFTKTDYSLYSNSMSFLRLPYIKNPVDAEADVVVLGVPCISFTLLNLIRDCAFPFFFHGIKRVCLSLFFIFLFSVLFIQSSLIRSIRCSIQNRTVKEKIS